VAQARVSETAPEAPADVPVAARPLDPPTQAAQVLALQRSIGNAAVTRLLQRAPAYNKNPPWSTKDAKQGPQACVPAPEWAARGRWEFWSRAFPDEAADRCGCPEVGDVWRAYFQATGSPRFVWSEATTPDSCVLKSLKTDPDHIPFEDPLIAAVLARIPQLLPRLAGQLSVRIPLADTGIAPGLLTPALDLNHNTRAGGSLFGGIGASEYGPDTRRVDGIVELTRASAPADPTQITVRSRFELQWHITDGVDFCPGNTGESVGGLLQQAVTAVSTLEAAGMARDIYVEANYTRIRDGETKGPFANPDP
jgi:hypothetical protein